MERLEENLKLIWKLKGKRGMFDVDFDQAGDHRSPLDRCNGIENNINNNVIPVQHHIYLNFSF